MHFELPSNFAFAVIDVVIYALMLTWMGYNVGYARKKYGVKLPAAYENKEDSVFNRYQRAHQNSVESAATFYAILLLSALGAPIVSAVAGLVYIIGRYLYCTGYYTGVSGRNRGGVLSYVGMLVLCGGCISFAVKLLTS